MNCPFDDKIENCKHTRECDGFQEVMSEKDCRWIVKK